MGFPCFPPPPHLVSASLCHMERGLVGLCHSASGLPPTLQDGEEPPPPPKARGRGFLKRGMHPAPQPRTELVHFSFPLPGELNLWDEAQSSPGYF